MARRWVPGQLPPQRGRAVSGGSPGSPGPGGRHAEPPPDTGCPICGSDDYDTELGPGGQPDYEHGVKKCQACGEEWT